MNALQIEQLPALSLAPEQPPPGPATRSLHGGVTRPLPYHSLTTPVVQTATYTFKDTADLCAFMDARMWGLEAGRTEYGRYGKPDRCRL